MESFGDPSAGRGDVRMVASDAMVVSYHDPDGRMVGAAGIGNGVRALRAEVLKRFQVTSTAV
jgi:hypothetical protein